MQPCRPPKTATKLAPCKERSTPSTVKCKDDFKIENMTVMAGLLLKVYYWEGFDIDGLNEKIRTNENIVEHDIHIPTCQVNSKPQKTILWLRNLSKNELVLTMKRIKNCDCQPQETKIGFNQFRKQYHCPHRRLLYIFHDMLKVMPGELVAMSIIIDYLLYGEFKLTYEMRCSDSRVVVLNFFLDIDYNDPLKSFLTRELLPADLTEWRRPIQPVWINNISKSALELCFHTRERGIRVVTPFLTVPPESVWPLLVVHRPDDLHSQVELVLTYEMMQIKFSVKTRGMLEESPKPKPEPNLPVMDIETSENKYLLFPNRLDFVMETDEERSLLVAVYNSDREPASFSWQKYVIPNLFEVDFEPEEFRLKPKHSKLCAINMKVHDHALTINRIPIVLEVHRVPEKLSKKAGQLLTEIESIDDSKWKENTFIEAVYLHLNLKVNFPDEPDAVVEELDPKSPKDVGTLHSTTTIFEKLFWNYLSQSDHMSEPKKNRMDDSLAYEELLLLVARPIGRRGEMEEDPAISNNEIMKTLSYFLKEAVREISKDWKFVPPHVEEASD